MALKAPFLLDFRHKKRRPWTSLDGVMVGRGRLNGVIKLLILDDKISYEYYRHTSRHTRLCLLSR